MHRIDFLTCTLPARNIRTALFTVPIKSPVPNSTLQTIQKMENRTGNPLLAIIKNLADNPQRLQEELKKLVNGGQEKVCNYLLGILALKDPHTAKHAKEVARTARSFAKEVLGLSKKEIRKIEMSALLHDIGKIFTPSRILKKPGKLNEEEYRKMSEHAYLGKKFLEQLGLTKICNSFKDVAELAEKHHSSYDTFSLSKPKTIEEEVLKLSDVFNALTEKGRPYKKPFSTDEALKIMIKKQEDTKFWSPDLFKKFVKFARKNYC